MRPVSWKTKTYRRLRTDREEEFAAEPKRAAVFAGSAYPDEAGALSTVMTEQVGAAQGARFDPRDCRSPCQPGRRLAYLPGQPINPFFHESWRATRYSCCWALRIMEPRTGSGLTRKNFVTPYGEARTETALVNELTSAADGAVNGRLLSCGRTLDRIPGRFPAASLWTRVRFCRSSAARLSRASMKAGFRKITKRTAISGRALGNMKPSGAEAALLDPRG